MSLRRRSFNNNPDENYSGLTGYDEMSTRQVGAAEQPAGFGYSESAAQSIPQAPAQAPSSGAPLYTPPPQNPFDSLFGGSQSGAVQNNNNNNNNNFGQFGQQYGGFAQQNNNNNNYSQQSFFGQNNYGGNNGYAPQNQGAPQNNGYVPQGGERPMVFSIDRDPNGYIYEYSDRLEYYRYTGAGMVLINSVKKHR